MMPKLTLAPMPRCKLSGDQVQIVGVELERIWREKSNLKPQTIVQEATPISSPLHDFFTWDESEAANRWREEEARQIVRSIRIVRQDMPLTEQPVIRKFVSVSASSTEKRFAGHSYIPMEEVAEDADYRQQALNAAMDELRQWQIRHDNLREFFGVYAEIATVERSLTARGRARPVKAS